MKIKVIGISGSPRKNSNTEVLVREALSAASDVEGVETELITLGGKKILPCIGCFKCVENKSLCIFKDKDYMGELYEKWFEADGIVIGSPVYHLSVPGVFKNVIDRLGEGVWSIRNTNAIGSGWLCKAGGVITQGMASFGGQELTAQYLVNHLMVMNCLVVPAEFQTAPGVAGSFDDIKIYEPGLIGEYDKKAIQNSRIMGKRVAETAKILRRGIFELQDELGEEYKNLMR